MPSPEPHGSNRTLERVVAILDAVEHSAVSATELARRTELSVSTAHRLALSMVEYGFLHRTRDGTFRLGRRFLQSALEKIAAPALRDLRETTGETAQLWVRRGDERVCVLSEQGGQELRVTLPPGARLPLPAGSSGRILAEEPQALEEIGTRGWVESVGQRTPGLGSVSAPITAQASTVAVVCLAMPLARVRRTPGAEFGDAVAATARRISQDLEQAGS